MKKFSKVALIVVAIIILLLLLVVLLISPVSKWYIEKYSKDLIGRRITIENFDLQLLKGQAFVDNFVLYEANDVDTFVSIGHVGADVQMWGIVRQSIVVDSFNIVAPNITVMRRNNRMNFDDMLQFMAGSDDSEPVDTTQVEEPAADKMSWDILVRNIAIKQGRVRYADDFMGIDWTMKRIGVSIPEIDLSGNDAMAQLNFDFEQGGNLTLDAMYDKREERYGLNLLLADYPIQSLKPFMKGMANLGDISGNLRIDLNVAGALANIIDSDITGAVRIDSTAVYDIEGNHMASLRQFRTDIERINISHDYVVKLANLHIDGLSSQFEMFGNGRNTFSTLLSSNVADSDTTDVEFEQQEAEVSDSLQHTPQLDFSIRNISLANSNFTYTDHTLPEPFKIALSQMRFKTPSFSNRGVNEVELNAALQKTGSLRVKWKGNLEKNDHDVTIALNNFNLRDISPYSLDMFAYPIKDGKMSFVGQDIISSGQLKGTNKLSLYHPTLDKKRKDIDAPYDFVPLKLAFVVLTDRQGKADIELPVSGDINSPQFSYGSIIVKALVNVLVKIATAPFDLLAGLFGMNSDEVKEIKFDAWQYQFTPEQYDKIEKLSKVVADKPELKAQLTHEVNFNKGIDAIVENEMRRAYYLSQNPHRADSLNMIDVDAYSKISLQGAAVNQCADSLLTVKELPTDGSLKDKMHRLYGSGAEGKLMRNIEMRNRAVVMQWTKLGLPESSIEIITLPLEEIKKHKGETRYNVELVLSNSEE